MLAIWIYASIKMVEPEQMLRKYYMITPKELLVEYARKHNFYIRIKRITLVSFVGHLIYYFLFK